MSDSSTESGKNRRQKSMERRQSERREYCELNYSGEERRKPVDRRSGEERRFVYLSDYLYDIEGEM